MSKPGGHQSPYKPEPQGGEGDQDLFHKSNNEIEEESVPSFLDKHDIPFSVDKAAEIPCGVWIKHGETKWRVLDRQIKAIDIVGSDSEGSKKETVKPPEVKKPEIVVKKPGVKKPDLKMSDDWNKKPLIRRPGLARRNALRAGHAPKRPPMYGAVNRVTPFGGQRAEGKGLRSFGQETQCACKACACIPRISPCLLVTERGFFGRGMTFLTGLLMMLVGGMVHHLVIQIDWDKVWRSMGATGDRVQCYLLSFPQSHPQISTTLGTVFVLLIFIAIVTVNIMKHWKGSLGGPVGGGMPDNACTRVCNQLSDGMPDNACTRYCTQLIETLSKCWAAVFSTEKDNYKLKYTFEMTDSEWEEFMGDPSGNKLRDLIGQGPTL